MQRTLVSYDDLVQPTAPAAPVWNGSQAHSATAVPGPPPKKKQRRQRQQRRNQTQQNGHWPPPQQFHWDDPAAEQPPTLDTNMALLSAGEQEKGGEEDEGEMSRILTHEEIWDDSALIDAWESATAEYEAYHGKGKEWKKEPVKKSPLWYNVPPVRNSGVKQPKIVADDLQLNGQELENSQPIDFATYMPDHDPTFDMPQMSVSGVPVPAPGVVNFSATGEAVSKDEAFSRAMGAMYWAGYWTAVYHSHDQGSSQPQAVHERREGEVGGDDGEYAEDGDDIGIGGQVTLHTQVAQGSSSTPALSFDIPTSSGDDDLIPTQR